MAGAVDPLIAAFLVSTIGSMLRTSAPILFTALGENFSESSGVLNLGTEGMMLLAAFLSYIVALSTGSVPSGLMAGIAIGMFLGILMAFITVTLKADQIVTGIAITFLAIGITSYLIRMIYGTGLPPRLPPREAFGIPFLSSIPMVGRSIFTQPILVWVAIALVPLCHYVLYRTAFGLRIRAVGEDPMSADVSGVNVFAYRYVALIIGGALAGLGGSFLSLYQLSTFIDNMTQGRGWIAIAIVMFGRWNSSWVLVGALIYGGAEALAGSVQALGALRGVPSEFLLALPYVLTIIALVVIARKAAFPGALGRPYRRESR